MSFDEKTRLMASVNKGEIPLPDRAQPSIPELARTLFSMMHEHGDGRAPQGIRPDQTFHAMLSGSDHYIFIMLDALGTSTLKLHAPNGFLSANTLKKLNTVIPTATTAAITSYATGLWPSEHAAVGWWTYLPERNVNSVLLPFQNRFTGQSLAELDITPEETFAGKALFELSEVPSYFYFPGPIVDSIYSRFSSGSRSTRIGYDNFSEVTADIAARLQKASDPSYFSVYFSEIDSLCHNLGTDHERVQTTVCEIDRLVMELHEKTRGKATIVVTADHGQIFTPESLRFTIARDSRLASCLVTPSTGEPRMPFFHVKPGMEDQFKEQFLDQFSEHFALITPVVAEELQLLGTGTLAPATVARLGTFIGIPLGNAIVEFSDNPARHEFQIGQHGGLSRDELEVPLIVCR